MLLQNKKSFCVQATFPDGKMLALLLPNVFHFELLDYPGCSHMDFALGIDGRKIIYDPIIKMMEEFWVNQHIFAENKYCNTYSFQTGFYCQFSLSLNASFSLSFSFSLSLCLILSASFSLPHFLCLFLSVSFSLSLSLCLSMFFAPGFSWDELFYYLD